MLGQLIFSGISQGAIYAFVAISLTVIFRATTLVNFGHGELYMASAFIIYIMTIILGYPIYVSILVSLLCLFIVGMMIERIFIRPISKAPHLSIVMMTIAIGYILRGIIRYFWGREVLPMPSPLNIDPIVIDDIVMTGDDIVIIASVIICLLIFFLVFHTTRIGKLAQAMFQSSRGAMLIGTNVNAFNMTIWGVGACMAALAGVLVAPVTLLYPDMGASILIRGFAAMTLGGFGSLHGAVIGGVLLGILEQLCGAYLNTALIDITGYLVIILVLIIKPSGLFGKAKFRRV